MPTLELTDAELDWLSESVKLMQTVRNGVFALVPGEVSVRPTMAGSEKTIEKIDGIFNSLVGKLDIDDYYKSEERK